MSSRSEKRRCLARAWNAPAPRLRDLAIVGAAFAILVLLPRHEPAPTLGIGGEARLVTPCVFAEDVQGDSRL
jgi:hypothetical protein